MEEASLGDVANSSSGFFPSPTLPTVEEGKRNWQNVQCPTMRKEREKAKKNIRLLGASKMRHIRRESYTLLLKKLNNYIPREFGEILTLRYVFLPLPTPRNFSWPGARSTDDRPTDQRGIALRRGRRKRIEEVAAANPAFPENGAACRLFRSCTTLPSTTTHTTTRIGGGEGGKKSGAIK